jgi:glycosyltransferase involved in cell wall biosynthesis
LENRAPIRIVVINDHAHVNGGASRIALTSAYGLAERGFPVYLVTAVAPILDRLDRVEVICTGQEEILRDPNRLRAAAQGWWNPTASRRIGELLDTLDPSRTVVHLHTWTKALSSSVVRAAVRRGFRIVCTLHDYFTACPNGGFFDYPVDRICRRIPLSAECVLRDCDVRNYGHKLWRVGRQIVQRRLGGIPGGISGFIAYSRLCRDVLAPLLPRGAKIQFVQNPIDLPREPRIPAETNGAYAFVGRLSREKGPHLFAQAARESGVDPHFVGDGTTAPEIRRIHPSARITGWIPPEEVREAMKGFRSLVFPSLWYETQGLVVLEAAALGIPSVVADTCAAREFVEDGVTGFWFKGGEAESLKERISALKDDGAVRRLSENAYAKYWDSPPTLEAHLDRLLEVYDTVLHADLPEEG